MPCRLPVDLHTFQGILYTKGRYFSMAKSFNYRKYYKDYYGIDFDSSYVIHHIDFDRSNNDINNLILLPSKLHSRYHFLLTGFNPDKNNKGIASLDFKIVSECGSIPMFGINMMKNLCETMVEIDKWVRIKSDMDNEKYNKEKNGI